jgi:DNA-binding SARP family transcriptional activator
MRMLEKRDVVRMIVAPRGFGKTTLLREYVNQVFSGVDVIWFDGSDPLLICSIDDGTFPVLPEPSSSSLRLLVIDDLPFLDETRRAVFERAIDDLLDGGVEVVCALSPSSDVLTSLRKDAVVIEPHDLFVTDEEYRRDLLGGEESAPVADGDAAAAGDVFDGLAAARDLPSSPVFDPLRSWGIPSLVWGDVEFAASKCLQGFFEEHLPDEFVDVAVAMALLEDGTLEDIAALGLSTAPDIFEVIEERYPLFGIDRRTRSFHAVPLGSRGLELCAPQISKSRWHGPSGLFGRLIGLLLERDRLRRASQVMLELGTTEGLDSFLAVHADHLLDQGLTSQVLALARRLGIAGVILGEEHTFPYVFALMLSGACEQASRYLEEIRAVRSLGTKETVLAHALDIPGCSLEDAGCGLTCVNTAQDQVLQGAKGLDCGCTHTDPEGSCQLVNLMVHSLRGEVTDDLLFKMLEGNASAGVRVSANTPLSRFVLHLLLKEPDVASRVLPLAGDAVGSGSHHDVAPVVSLTRSLLVLDLVGAREGTDCPVSEAQTATARIVLRDVPLFAGTQTPASVKHAFALPTHGQLGLPPRPQSVEHPCDPSKDDAGQGARLTLPIVYEEAAERPLFIKMFGGFEVFEDGVLVNNAHLAKKQARHLLAMLALNKGREVSRDHIFSEMWPSSDSHHARNCFYIVWGHVRAGLGIDDTRNYVIFRESTLALNRHLVDTDVAQFERIYRMLLSSTLPTSKLVDSFVELERIYRGDLLTSDFKSHLFERKRLLYRDMFIDAMVGASDRAANESNATVALWFARTAFEFTHAREDVWAVLARAQLISGQRSASLRTIKACRHYMLSQYHVDLSERMMGLYRLAMGN